MEKKPYQIEAASEYTGLKVSYLHKLCHLGKIPHYRPNGGRVYFLEEDLEAFLLRGRRAADYELGDRADAILAKTGSA